METAKITEIFLSYQGEGPYAGSRQLFVRFYGCNRCCAYCDTKIESYKTFTKDSIMSRIISFENDYNELVLTGGEPLLYPKFISDLLKLYRNYRKKKIYLETNGTLPWALREVIGLVDIVAMDFKLPSSTQEKGDVWPLHEEFASIASAKELVMKAVISDSTTMADIKRMSDIIKRSASTGEIVLQPVTPTGPDVKEPDEELMLYFKKFIEKETDKHVLVLGQLHKCLGVR